jgi:hypothetical protein
VPLARQPLLEIINSHKDWLTIRVNTRIRDGVCDVV